MTALWLLGALAYLTSGAMAAGGVIAPIPCPPR